MAVYECERLSRAARRESSRALIRESVVDAVIRAEAMAGRRVRAVKQAVERMEELNFILNMDSEGRKEMVDSEIVEGLIK